MKPSRDISGLIEIMAALRNPKTGCPWDIKQDFNSIKPYTIEEAYEVADAIERNDYEDLCDELGDLLLQVVFHARMAEEQELFSFEDVVEAITRKMIRRHPHVFERSDADTPDKVKAQWADIKAAEKRERTERRAARGLPEAETPGQLTGVPRALPALMEALKLQEAVSRVGFDWGSTGPVFEKMEEEIGELRAEVAAGNSKKAAQELGDVLFTVANLARFLKTDPEDALRATNTKVRTRFAYVEAELAKQGKTPGEVTLDEMEALWQAAKSQL
jgi:nucleoside triphosphate diphosphatase